MAKAPRFDAAWNRKRRWRSAWRRWRWLLGLALIAAGYWALRGFDLSPGEWEQVETRWTLCETRSSRTCVVDGDTVVIGEERVRLTGFDAPELDGACPAERQLAIVARDELRQWLDLAPFEWDGGAEAPRDQYGRQLRAVRRDGEYLADVMIERELAGGSGWGFTKDWCAAS